MDEPREVVTVFARNGGRFLLEHTDAGWDGLTRPLDDSIENSVEQIMTELIGTSQGISLARIGDDIMANNRNLRIYPVLLDVFSRTLETDMVNVEWRHPTILCREPSAELAWEAYLSVAPRERHVVEDREHGSTTLSLEALQVLRDQAATGQAWENIAETAKQFIDARSELTALVTRIDRTMSRIAAGDQSPEAMEAIAREEIDEAVRADEEAAHRAQEFCEGRTVLTLSQSGTVQASLTISNPEEILLLESRPECEAIPVAETLASSGRNVSLLLDAAAADVLCRRDIDVVLLGADSIDPNGDVRNKVGTRNIATAARHEGIPVVVVTSSDKISAEPPPDAWVDGTTIYDGPLDIDTKCRLFDRTSPDLITELVTEVGTLTPEITVWIAAERRRQRVWRENPERLHSV